MTKGVTAAMKELESAIASTSFALRLSRMTNTEAAIYFNYLAVKSRMKGSNRGEV